MKLLLHSFHLNGHMLVLTRAALHSMTHHHMKLLLSNFRSNVNGIVSHKYLSTSFVWYAILQSYFIEGQRQQYNMDVPCDVSGQLQMRASFTNFNFL